VTTPSTPSTPRPARPARPPPSQATTHDQITAARRQLGRELAAWRARAGLFQREVADRSGYKRSTITSAEAGEPLSGDFWAAVDPVVDAQGSLIASHARTQAAIRAARQHTRTTRSTTAQPTTATAQTLTCPHCHRTSAITLTPLPPDGPSPAVWPGDVQRAQAGTRTV
jgi:hypothetical protein